MNQTRIRLAPASLALALAAAAALSCGGPKRRAGAPPNPGTSDAVLAEQPPGLALRLSDADAPLATDSRPPLAEATPLPDDRVAALLARLPALPAPAGDRQAFALRPSSAPPPRAGGVAQTEFPPPATTDAPPASAGAPLQVVRAAPEGEVAMAPHVSVTFSAPMVAVTGQDDAAATQPVQLSPQPAGRWRWVGTRTILFDPDVRLPMATAYTTIIPAGTRAVTGETLDAPVTVTFTTPPPNVVARYPSEGPQPLTPVMFLQFDQAIDPDTMGAHVTVKAEGATLATRPATPAEVAGDEVVRELMAEAERQGLSDRTLTLRPVQPLPPDTAVAVTVERGAPSAEGPLTTEKVQTHTFRTYPPLTLTRAACMWGAPCPPDSPWVVELSTPLASDTDMASAVAIEPALPGADVQLQDTQIVIMGRASARTTYRLTLSDALTDRFGQRISGNRSATIRTGDAEPMLSGPSGFVVLDPHAKPAMSVFSRGQGSLRVRAYRVGADDWSRYQAFMGTLYQRNEQPTPPGARAFERTLEVADRAALTETTIDLSAALTDGHGHAIIVVEPAKPSKRRGREAVIAWVQASQIGLDAFADASELHAWANALTDGAPLGGVTLSIAPGRDTATSAADGTATLQLPAKPAKPQQPRLLVATRGDDVAILPEYNGWWQQETSWRRSAGSETLRWFVFDDRNLYRPGETARLKGWIRRVGAGPRGDLAALGDAASTISYRLVDPRGNELTKGDAKLSAAGGFDLALALPANVNLGYATVELTARGGGSLDGRSYQHQVQIQEFRRPEFEVGVSASPGPHVIGGHAELEVSASYFAGGGLAGAPVRWVASAQPASFTPPNWDRFWFGYALPFWMRPMSPDGSEGYAEPETHEGTTDAQGRHRLRIDFDSARPLRAMTVHAEASVQDVNRQSWSAATDLLVHPAMAYVGLRSDAMFVERGTPLTLQAIAVDLDGAPLPGVAIQVRAATVAYRYEAGSWVEREEHEQRCELSAAKAPVECKLATDQGGMMRVRARVTDAEGRPNETEIVLWVSGGEQPPARNVELEQVRLIPDKQEYAPGDTAKVLVQAPFSPAEALVSYRRSGMVKTARVTLSGPTLTLQVPIEDAYTPNLHLQVDLVGETARLTDRGAPATGLPPRPAFATGAVSLPIPPVRRTLAVTATPETAKLSPGAKTAIAVRVVDAAGAPVKGAEVAVVVVDEAILALAGYDYPSPLDAMYAPREAGVMDYRLRAFVQLARAERRSFGGATAEESATLQDSAPAPEGYGVEGGRAEMARGVKMASMAPGGGGSAPIVTRENFDALAVFAPAVRTDARGGARVPVTLPDNLTRYRVVAIATDGARQFGKGESTLTARLPLMVRPSAPRFLNYGDRFELPVVVQNQTDEPMTVELAVRARNATLTAGAGRRVSVPANDRVEVRFPSAAADAGTARFQLAAASGASSDAATVALPVWTPATSEAFATYGSIEGGATRQPIAVPSGAIPSFGQLEVTTSTTQLQALTDALLYLVDYPFACSEQLASRVLAVANLRDVLTAFAAEGLPAPAALAEAVARDLERLAAIQNHDGGFSFWRQGDESWPFLSVHAAHALVRAQQEGYALPADALERSLQYLRDIGARISGSYGRDTRMAIMAYAVSVRARAGDVDIKAVRALIDEAGDAAKLPREAAAWLLHAVARDGGAKAERAALKRALVNAATETAGSATIATSYADGNGYLVLHSDRRVDALALEALIAADPNSDLIEKLVRGLLAHRAQGRWDNTQENAFALSAFHAYFAAFEGTVPGLTERTWLGRGLAGERRFEGRETTSHHIEVPMSYLLSHPDARELTIAAQGRGRLYYRVGMRYAPASLSLAAADHGFAVERQYAAVDDPGDVRRDDDGTWRVRAGARVLVRVTMVAESRRHHVALVDPLPAGLEPLEPALATTGSVPSDPGAPQLKGYWWWFRPWYEHQNTRDERVEAFASTVWAGVHDYSYVARATTPGRFAVPPARAEEMYAPETFGRSASATLIVE